MKNAVLNPKVSVIIPVYNVEKYLEECITSIQKQTLEEIEIICINDGSTDSSLQILKKLSADDQRIVIIDQKNSGAGKARNNGIAIAKGEYIGFVDSDDIIYPTMYAELYNKAISTNAEMVITGEIETFFGDNICFPEKNAPVTADELCLGAFKAIEYPEILKNVFLWNRIFSREFWIKNNFIIPENRKFAEDLLICTQTSVLAKKIAYVKGPLYKYRNVRENSLSDTLAKSKNKMDFIIAVNETKEFLEGTEQYDFFAYNFVLFCTHMFVLLQKRMANYKCFKAFVHGVRGVLEEDIDTINDSWLFTQYPSAMKSLKTGKTFKLYIKNKFS